MKINYIKQHVRMSLSWLAGVAVVGLAISGCGGNSLPPSADPNLAQQALKTTLDAWQRGEKPTAVNIDSKAVNVIDRNWDEGSKLVHYDVKGEGLQLGLNRQLQVKLEYQDPKGKQVEKVVNYVVSTGNPIVVARQDIDD